MKNNKFYFSHDWLAGFTQADGSFIISFGKSKGKLAVRPTPVFNLTQNISELEMFKALHAYLGVGNLQINEERQNVTLMVKSTKDIVNVILPIFDAHPLRGGKRISYEIFKKVALMIENKDHLSVEGMLKIIELSYFMNKDTTLRTEMSKQELINLILKDKIELNSKLDETINLNTNINSEPINSEFIRGIIDGDGSFNISFRMDRRRIGVNFTVVNELASISVLYELKQYFNCGAVYSLPSKAARFQVQTVNDILEKIQPVFKNVKFNTVKQSQFEILIKVCELIKNKGYKTDENLKAIADLAWNMNKSGINRKVSKAEYLNKFIN